MNLNEVRDEELDDLCLSTLFPEPGMDAIRILLSQAGATDLPEDDAELIRGLFLERKARGI